VTPRVVDFSKLDDRPRTSEGKLLTDKQIRARARRRMKRATIMTDQEHDALYKPVEEWDIEELARGRPRNSKGTFAGAKPKWITVAVHEEAMNMFRQAVKGRMNGMTPMALEAIVNLVENEEYDDKGKPVVPASTKLDAAKFLLEHVVGKPTQRVEGDISVKLQGILGVALANPAETFGGNRGYTPGHLPGVTMAIGSAADLGPEEDEDVGDLNG